MIFSLSSEIYSEVINFPSDELDVYCFFQREKSISLTPEDIVPSMLSSLRQKRGVLILDKSVSHSEKFDFNRGLRHYEGNGLIYLAPHSLSLLRTQISVEILTFQDVKQTLILSNLSK